MEKTFRIKISHTVYVDSFEEGETKYINSYDTVYEAKGLIWQDALIKTMVDNIDYEFSLKNAHVDQHSIHWTSLVDKYNVGASEQEVEKWKLGKLTLYSNNMYITIDELVPLEFI